MRALGEPDGFPSSDLGLLRAMDVGNSRDLELRAEAWRPWRAYAAMYLWSICSRLQNRENRTVAGKSQKAATAITVPYRPVSTVV
jgi:3-methyladenine DNA glycosylase/8-oxoguanine DNA glycosylase